MNHFHNLAGSAREDQSGYYGSAHIYSPAYIKLPKWATHERLSGLKCDDIVVTDCCLCRMRADETTVEIVTGHPLPHGLDLDAMTEEERSGWLWGTFYESWQNIECGEGFGCTVKPRRRASRHLREHLYEY